ncbi:MAG: hypothetical protein JHC95_03365 [Solirubrobacteraceae bacterium]|nr:hypothetical protein [Solirubrobacteraceae bacterium]
MIFLRYLDLAVLALALPVFIAADLPLGGYATGAVIWLLWRGIGSYTDRKAAEADDARKTVGIATGSMIGRGWMMGILLIAVGLLTNDDVGLSAAVLCVVLFTVSFTARMILRPFEGSGGTPGTTGSPTPSS